MICFLRMLWEVVLMTMINVKLMTQEAYLTLRTNSEEVIKQINDHPSDSTWLKNYLGFEPYETKDYQIEDFDLLSGDAENAAFKNGVTLYEHLKDLPRYILCNTRFWAWINFEKAYKQAIYAMELKKSIFETWWLPKTSGRRFVMLGVISRLYFRVEISANQGNQNPYELTNLLFESVDELYRNFVYRNMTMVSHYTRGILTAMRDYKTENNVFYNKAVSREIMKASTKIGSIMLVDVMTEEEIYAYMMPRIKNIMEKSAQN